jgi:hypothetical protein
MRTTAATAAAMLVGVVAVVCCTGLPLIAAMGTTALAGWLSHSGYVAIAAALIAAGVGALWLQHRRLSAQECCRPEVFNKASKHE